jgi:hypothetical protein
MRTIQVKAMLAVAAAALTLTACTGTPSTAPTDSPTLPSSQGPQTQGPIYGSSVGDGIWTVGVETPAGRYQATADVSSKCYWWIYQTGNMDKIFSNGVSAQGRPVVELKEGEDFQAWYCGTWAKIG